MNLKNCEIVTNIEYLDEKRLKLVLNNQKAIKDYAYIIHHSDKKEDGSPKALHYHICLRFHYAQDTKYIGGWFGLQESQVSKIKGRWVDALKYLTHANKLEKFQYDASEVVSNYDWKKDIDKFKKKEDLNKYLDMIDKGEIREYNQFESIPIEIWSRNKTVIANALQYYKERIFMNKDREINVIFITGDTGTGKTTYAKEYARVCKKSICISSCSNDAMQDYKGEDILVLDDLRDDSFSFTDLLKILDNHTKSTMKSRYNNKGFIGDTIIITSYKDIEAWYNNVNDESKCQLYRRISTKMVFTDEVISAYEWNNVLRKYEYQGRVKNVYKMKAKEKVNMALSMLKVVSDDVELLDKAQTKVDNMTEEEIEQILLVDNSDTPWI